MHNGHYVSVDDLSLGKQAVILAYNKGYRVLQNGELLGLRGKIVKPLIERRKTDGYIKLRYGIHIYCAKTGKRKQVCFTISHLAAYQKYRNALFEPGIEVRHLNNNSADNSLDNIAIGTHSENMRDVPPEVRRKRNTKGQQAATAKVRKFTTEQIQEIRALREAGWTYTKLCEKFNCVKSTMSYIINRRTYSGVA